MNGPTAAYSILQKHLPAYMLEGYCMDIIDENNGRLYAFTFVEINPETFEGWYSDWGCCSMWVDEEKTRIYLEDGCFQHKDASQCARDGIYKSFSLKFYGAFYENRWYIQKDLIYFGELVSSEGAIEFLSKTVKEESVLSASIYEPMLAYFPQWNPAEPPMRRGVEYDEFIGMPELVAYIRQEEKRRFMQAKAQFLYLDLFSPTLDQIRIAQFEEFHEYCPLYPEGSSLIFSKERNLALLPLMIMNSRREYRIYYFVWIGDERKIYQWKYFQSAVYLFSFHYPEEIIKDLSQVSYWNDTAYLFSSCTLDDESFWQNHVLSKQNGEFKYLLALKY